MAETDIGGFVRFNITATPQEMRDWPANRIAMFFNGVAQVVHTAGENARLEILNDGDTNERAKE